MVFVCYSFSYLMVKSDLKKSIPFKSYSKNSEWPSKKFVINMPIFVLERYLCYKYWAMCYEVFLMCYNRSPINNFVLITTEKKRVLGKLWNLNRYRHSFLELF